MCFPFSVQELAPIPGSQLQTRGPGGLPPRWGPEERSPGRPLRALRLSGSTASGTDLAEHRPLGREGAQGAACPSSGADLEAFASRCGAFPATCRLRSDCALSQTSRVVSVFFFRCLMLQRGASHVPTRVCTALSSRARLAITWAVF